MRAGRPRSDAAALMMAPPWDEFDRELDRWVAADLVPRLWLRDDDAVAATPALDRLLALSEQHQVPVLLAVVPLCAEAGLARRLERAPLVSPAQHGCSHRNHAGPGEKKAELGAHPPLAAVIEELGAARDRFAHLFGRGLCPVMVPPWNRIAPAVEAELPRLDFAALSAFGHKPATDRIRRIDCDVDIMDWKTRTGQVPAALVPRVVASLVNARVDGGRAIGILTHHLVHDAVAWTFLAELCARTRACSAVQWVSFEALMRS